jgi:hypothetical protein
MKTLQSILKLKCPRCRSGDLFIKSGLFRFNKILEMNVNCPNCGLKYELEPGFWIGSLWASYPIVVLIELPFLLSGILISTINVYILFILMVLTMLLFYPLMLRLGRSIWIHIFISKQ